MFIIRKKKLKWERHFINIKCEKFINMKKNVEIQ